MTPRDELISFPKYIEGIRDELVTPLEIVKDLSAQNEVTPVDPDIAFPRCLDPAYCALAAGAQTRDDMETLARRYTEKGSQLGAVVAHVLDHFVERGVCQVVSVVGEEHLVTLEKRLDLLEALTNVGVKARVYQGDIPAINLAGEMLDVLYESRPWRARAR